MCTQTENDTNDVVPQAGEDIEEEEWTPSVPSTVPASDLHDTYATIIARTYRTVPVTNKWTEGGTGDMFLPVTASGVTINEITSGGSYSPVWEGGRPNNG